MAKINATYSSGYYLSHDTDFRKLEEEEAKLRVAKRKRERDGKVSKDDIKRQTFAMPFNVVCLHCNRRNSRGTHGYVNRRGTAERYLGMRVWELECRCIFCKGLFYLKTDYETPKITGGYVCDRFCKRGEGDFYSVNKVNEMLRKQREAEEAQLKDKTLEALERESEMMRQVHERQRRAFEVVEERADRDDMVESEMLLSMIRRDAAKKKQQQQSNETPLEKANNTGYADDDAFEDSPETDLNGKDENEDDGYDDEEDEKAYADFQQRLELMALEEEKERENDGGGSAAVPERKQEGVEGQKSHVNKEDEEDAEDDDGERKCTDDTSSVEHVLAQMKLESRGNRFAAVAPEDTAKSHPVSSSVQRPLGGCGLLATMFDDDDDDEDNGDDDGTASQ